MVTEGRVLIVDDSPIDTEILSNLMRDLAVPTVAHDATEALAALELQDFDVILLDVMLDGEDDGFDLCRHIKTSLPRHANTPVVFVSGRDDLDSERRGLGLGALDFIAKPYSAPIVRARITNYIALSQTQRKLIQANAELERLAVHDGLTGLVNRRHFHQVAEADLNRAERSGRPLSVLLLDLDHFKTVNDTHGHAAGDVVLKAVADAWRDQLRAQDHLARLGGEEFAILLPDTTSHQAQILGERLLRVTRQLKPEWNNVVLSITVSIGVASRLPGRPIDLPTLLMAGDTALYAAKREGRNRMVVAPMGGTGDSAKICGVG